jgi:hypothetical protein
VKLRAVHAIAAATVAVAVVLWAIVLRSKEAREADGREVDLVLVIDTTASMGMMLDAVRETFYDIAAHTVASGGTVDLRVGLVAYRDVGDDYVTRDLPLTASFDRVYEELRGYSAVGGGDAPEDVEAALDDLVHSMGWRDDAVKVAILIGDAPPARREDVPSCEASVKLAVAKHIVIDAIWYGADPDTERAWHAITAPTGGDVQQLDMRVTAPTFRATVETMVDHELSKR